jgi:cellobiose-specific phosphotransferase system component IIA
MNNIDKAIKADSATAEVRNRISEHSRVIAMLNEERSRINSALWYAKKNNAINVVTEHIRDARAAIVLAHESAKAELDATWSKLESV